METTPAFRGLDCRGCGEAFAPETTVDTCPDCGGILDPAYDYGAISLTRETLEDRPFDGLWRYEELLPFAREASVTMNEGTTPLVPCPDLAAELGVSRVFIKDEGHNPTNASADRGQALAVSAAHQHGASDVALPSTGNGGQAAAAYGARAGLDTHVFLPSRSTFGTKAMVNVHGGDMTVVEGRLTDAREACEETVADNDEWYSVAPFETPYQQAGTKTVYYEIAEQLDWEVPDAIIHPTASGIGLAGLHKGATEFEELGLTDEVPRLYAAQAEGCAPIVEAWQAGTNRHEPWERPDTICGAIEVADPAGGPWALEALRKSGGGAIATPDEDVLSSAITVAQNEGVEIGASAAAAASGAWELAEAGTFGSDETVVLINTAAGDKESDVLRSHLMGMGI